MVYIGKLKLSKVKVNASNSVERKKKYLNNNDSENVLTAEQIQTLGFPLLNYYEVQKNVFAGEYPFSDDLDVGLMKLDLLRGLGISFIIDLTEENELKPYKNYLDQIEYYRFSIVDREIPSSMDATLELVKKINIEISNGKVIYVHCRGGVGRTGTIIACWFVYNGQTAIEAIENLNSKWKHCPKSKYRTHCPEYVWQKDFIKGFEDFVSRNTCNLF